MQNGPGTVAYHTLGCKLNFAETSAIARMFAEKGFVKKAFTEKADIYVLNTCSVTANADSECRSLVKAALSRNPAAFIAVVGCYAQLKPQEIASIPGVDVVLGAADKFRLLEHLNHAGKNPAPVVKNCSIDEVNTFVPALGSGDRTRSFLKVQDGCDYSCTFCTIPLARGRSRSDTIGNVVSNAAKAAAAGVKEIVLTGVNLGDFGYGSESPENQRKRRDAAFIDLVRELDTLGSVGRFRISSIEPNLLTDEVIDFVASSERFAPHFHIPLQSGSDRILALMKRRYRRGLYADRVAKIKALMPHASIGVDVIVGFPGESEDDFLETYSFIESLDVSYLHVFTYSERENTEAASMTGRILVEERKRRNAALRALSSLKLRRFYESQAGRGLRVLFEAENRDGMMEGYSENYVRVSAPYSASLLNKFANVKATAFDAKGNLSWSLQPAQLAET
jgi:threonylcarbamoyladenosine tRNA methylthiotransferase MtaB